MTIPFEKFVLDPLPYMKQTEQLLQTHMTPLTHKDMKRQNVPRNKISEGVSLPIYKKYGWVPPKKNSDEKRELEVRREFAIQHASREAMDVLDRLCQDYEKRWDIL